MKVYIQSLEMGRMDMIINYCCYWLTDSSLGFGFDPRIDTRWSVSALNQRRLTITKDDTGHW